MVGVPYEVRLLILLGVFASISLVDRGVHGSRARRWREYLFVVAGGGIGACFGAAVDILVSSRLAPEYFEWGKGIPGGEGFRGRIAVLGFQAGVAPGMLAAMIYLYVDSRRPERSSMGYWGLWVQLWKPTAVSILLGTVYPLVFGGLDPVGLRGALGTILSGERMDAVLIVWWIHLGLYTGFVAGLVWGARSVHRLRDGPIPPRSATAE